MLSKNCSRQQYLHFDAAVMAEYLMVKDNLSHEVMSSDSDIRQIEQ